MWFTPLHVIFFCVWSIVVGCVCAGCATHFFIAHVKRRKGKKVSALGSVSCIDVWTTAQTIYGELAPYADEDLLNALCWVMRNRYETARAQGKNTPLATICKECGQFQCWMPGTPKHKAMVGIALNDFFAVRCVMAAINVLAGIVPSPIEKAAFCCVSTSIPVSFVDKEPQYIIGRYLFFEDGV